MLINAIDTRLELFGSNAALLKVFVQFVQFRVHFGHGRRGLLKFLLEAVVLLGELLRSHLALCVLFAKCVYLRR